MDAASTSMPVQTIASVKMSTAIKPVTASLSKVFNPAIVTSSVKMPIVWVGIVRMRMLIRIVMEPTVVSVHALDIMIAQQSWRVLVVAVLKDVEMTTSATSVLRPTPIESHSMEIVLI